MNTYISLLRGINVSGQKSIKMVDLKTLYESLSFIDVETYIQSGNVLFKSPENDTQKLKAKIETAIKSKYGFVVPVQIISKTEMEKVVKNMPFKGEMELNRLFATFLAEKTVLNAMEEIETLKTQNDEVVFTEKVIYLYIPSGYGKSKLDNNTIERKLKVKATTRNWKTVLKLVEMA